MRETSTRRLSSGKNGRCAKDEPCIDRRHANQNIISDTSANNFRLTITRVLILSKVRTPQVYYDLTTPRVMTMEFVETLKLTDIPKIESLGLDKELLAKRSADSFLAQVVREGYFHCDPHPGKE